MEDLGKYSYLIFLLIYLVYNYFLKKKPTNQTQPDSKSKKDQSFDEVLRDILKQNKPEEKKAETITQSVKQEKKKRPIIEVKEKYVAPMSSKFDNVVVRDRKQADEIVPEIEESGEYLSIIDDIKAGEFDFKKAILIHEIMQRPRYV